MQFRPIGRIRLKGKVQEVEALEPVADGAHPADLAAYAGAYHLLAEGDSAAEGAFAALAERWPDDKLVAFHLARCRKGEVNSAIVLGHK
jgi:TolA-binding protein